MCQAANCFVAATAASRTLRTSPLQSIRHLQFYPQCWSPYRHFGSYVSSCELFRRCHSCATNIAHISSAIHARLKRCFVATVYSSTRNTGHLIDISDISNKTFTSLVVSYVASTIQPQVVDWARPNAALARTLRHCLGSWETRSAVVLVLFLHSCSISWMFTQTAGGAPLHLAKMMLTFASPVNPCGRTCLVQEDDRHRVSCHQVCHHSKSPSRKKRNNRNVCKTYRRIKEDAECTYLQLCYFSHNSELTTTERFCYPDQHDLRFLASVEHRCLFRRHRALD
jgi:hypothetical protein